jgi:hypothetical protein
MWLLLSSPDTTVSNWTQPVFSPGNLLRGPYRRNLLQGAGFYVTTSDTLNSTLTRDWDSSVSREASRYANEFFSGRECACDWLTDRASLYSEILNVASTLQGDYTGSRRLEW